MKQTKNFAKKPNNTSHPKTERVEAANKWLELLNTKWKKEVDAAKKNTNYIKDHELHATSNTYDTTILIFKQDVSVCVKACVTRLQEGEHACVLDFASYTNPGGGFTKGSIAQEEDICRTSGLYPCLAQFEDTVFKKRREDRLDGLYGDDYFYVKDCPFIVNGKNFPIDVIAMAAVNANATHATSDIVEEYMNKRMETVINAAASHGNTHLILGAFGCGVFGNDVEWVAKTWKQLLDCYKGAFKSVVFVVTDPKQKAIFQKILV